MPCPNAPHATIRAIHIPRRYKSSASFLNFYIATNGAIPAKFLRRARRAVPLLISNQRSHRFLAASRRTARSNLRHRPFGSQGKQECLCYLKPCKSVKFWRRLTTTRHARTLETELALERAVISRLDAVIAQQGIRNRPPGDRKSLASAPKIAPC